MAQNPVHAFINEYTRYWQQQLTVSQLSYETIELYRDEIDETMIPDSVLETLDEIVIASSIIFVDEKGDEYLRIAVLNDETAEYDKFVRWFINNEPIDWAV
ncbi:hypothetical protein [Lysinibacillus sphaericus]|uniref:hypothetical protein n=1 Tax=Lysinibacillus sphaericus TaxID=1421 RepID=UPI001CBDA079|nr:hypothetical protein [Lysinibacillus sphaericus]